MKNVFTHLRTFIFRGLLAIIPLLLCTTAIWLLYILIDKKVMILLDKVVDIRQIPGLGILLVLVFLYLLGLIVSNVAGRQIFHFIEGVSDRIPLIKAIYNIGKQLSESLSVTDSNKKAFQRAVLIDCFNGKGGGSLGFVTGTVINEQTGEELLKVFVPTVPNPTTGFVFIVHPSQTIDPGWTVEEAVKMILSAGIISPLTLKKGS